MNILFLIASLVMQAPSTGFRVSGRVVHQPNQAVQRVVLFGDGQIRRGTVAADGSFEFLQIRPGNYDVAVSPPAPGTREVRVTVVDRDVSDIELVLARLAAVTGAVTVESGRTRPSFSVTLHSPDYQTDVEISGGGPFRQELPPGDYRVNVDGVPAGFYLKSMTSGPNDLLAAPLRIVTADDSPRIALVFGISAGVAVSGRIEFPDDVDRMQARRIMLSRSGAAESIEAPIDEDGAFEFTKLMPGAYKARVLLSASVWSPPTPVVVPNKDLRDLKIHVPAPVTVSGRVAVDGNGPAPKFSLILLRGREAAVPTLTSGALDALARHADAAGGQVTQLRIEPLFDGTFKAALPEGEYRVATLSGRDGIPPAYSLNSLTYGPADLLKEPLVVSRANHAEIQVGFSATSPNPWVQLSGRVIGLDPTQGPYRVSIESDATAPTDTFVSGDGSFQFLNVLRDNRYTARLVPDNDAASTARVSVADKDVSGIQIVVPREREFTGRATVEGDAPIPGFMLALEGLSTMSVAVQPDADGAFKIKLPADERKVRVNNLPLGYSLKSLMYGSTNLRNEPLKIGDGKLEELRVTLALDESVPFGRLAGRIIGFDRVEGSVRLALTGVTALSTFETAVGLDGSFEFSKIPQGVYLASLVGGVRGALTPASIVVTSGPSTRVDLTLRPESARQASSSADAFAGVTVNEIGVNTDFANASKAIAYLRTINTALITYLSSTGGKYGSLQDLVTAGLLEARMASSISGYNLSLIPTASDYVAAAVPVAPVANRHAYYSTADAVIRHSTADVLAPAGMGGRPVQ